MKSPKPSSKTSSQGERRAPVKLRLSAAAEADFEAIDRYSAEQFGDDVADAYMRRFGDLFDLLRRHPQSGVATPELGKGMRSLSHRSHRILYRAEEDLVLIVRILHHAQDARNALGRLAHGKAAK